MPARAGFTVVREDHVQAGRDHPRSRGVYQGQEGDGVRVLGSSPLARGLPLRRRRVPGHQGIIPARAGFTPLRARRMPWMTDHPRSRGVYVISPFSIASLKGSSPLARGLLIHRIDHPHNMGIIPARAGFTRTHGTLTQYHRDHPRSRGVYRLELDAPGALVGSSPLARGLRGAGRLR